MILLKDHLAHKHKPILNEILKARKEVVSNGGKKRSERSSLYGLLLSMFKCIHVYSHCSTNRAKTIGFKESSSCTTRGKNACTLIKVKRGRSFGISGAK